MVLIIVVVVTGREECCMKGEEVRRRAQRDDRIGPGQRVAKKAAHAWSLTVSWLFVSYACFEKI